MFNEQPDVKGWNGCTRLYFLSAPPPPPHACSALMYGGGIGCVFALSLCNDRERFLQLLFTVAVTIIAFLSSIRDHYHHSTVIHTDYEYI